jgi:hypothetical protein
MTQHDCFRLRRRPRRKEQDLHRFFVDGQRIIGKIAFFTLFFPILQQIPEIEIGFVFVREDRN